MLSQASQKKADEVLGILKVYTITIRAALYNVQRNCIMGVDYSMHVLVGCY